MSDDFTSFWSDLRFAVRSLSRTKGLTVAVVLTLALGIGANAAIFTLVRGVLLRPLVNRDESRLIYIRQSAPGLHSDNTTWSMPEIRDLRSRVKTFNAFGDFSTVGFTMVGLGDPRSVQAGVVNGSYFDVMGLRPVLGRLIDARDDGPSAAGAVVLTYNFWTTAFKRDPAVLGKTVRLSSGLLGTRSATIVGVLEPSLPYPTETEIIANIVTSPHHMSATMVDGRIHRMTELYGRLTPGADLEQARAELTTVYETMQKQHPEAYGARAHFTIDANRLRDQITAGARTILLVLLAASVLIFVIACSNVANLILARTVRRETELGIRAALGASNAALRRILLAESLVLCAAGAALGVLSARPMVAILARYASRYSVRALDLTVDASMLWVGALLAIVAAVLLAYVPRLPNADSSNGYGLTSAGQRATGSATRRQRVFAVTQIAASFVLLAGASMLFKTLLTLQTAQTGFDTHQVLAIDVPVMPYGKTPDQIIGFYQETIRKVSELPGVDHVSTGTTVPWRDGIDGVALQFAADDRVHGPGEEDQRARLRATSPGFFAALGVPILSGRDFTDADRMGSEPVVVVSQSLAQRMFPNQSAVDHHLAWTDPILKLVPEMKIFLSGPRRIIGVAADVEDEHLVPGPAVTVYQPFAQFPIGARLFVHAHGDPYALVTPITRIIRKLSAEQVVERAATLEDIRAEVLTPNRLNTLVFGVFAAVALAIAIVGVAGVLAFSVSGRTREFGIRLAVGAQPSRLLARVLAEGGVMAAAGILAGAGCGYALIDLAGRYFPEVQLPSPPVVAGAAVVLLLAALSASAWPAARAARVDVMQALRQE
ncbi:MAG TPA: ADOP family duplicated permease [Bryobacteraceae bacterium]|nr:ADOP family duplicated permease [Bryobacteraceae bacterium]